MTATKPTTNAIGQAFISAKSENRAAFMPYLTAGYPTAVRFSELLDAAVEAGANLVEVGVPFSDPLADGATVQHSSQVALEQGMTLQKAFDLIRDFRSRGGTVPIVFMGYTNPFFQYGIERLADEAVDAGVNGFIIPDLPLEESEEFAAPLRARGRDLIFLVSPTSTEKRLAGVAEKATGFIYCVALTGVTGARDRMWDGLGAYVQRIRQQTDVPLAIGFGISTPQHVADASAIADGVIVASALLDKIRSAPEADQVAEARSFLADMKRATYRNGTRN